jgi:hypothetical protein
MKIRKILKGIFKSKENPRDLWNDYVDLGKYQVKAVHHITDN